MTKVCYVAPFSIHSFRWIEAFLGRGYDLSLITDGHDWVSKGWVSPALQFVPVYTLPRLIRKNLALRFLPNTTKMTVILKKINPDFIHLHVSHKYMPAIVLGSFPYMLSSWGVEVLRLPYSSILDKGLARMVATKARMVTTDAECLKQIWIELGIPGNKIEVIPFGVDTSVFNPNADGHAIREKFEIGKKDTVVISTRPFYNDHYNVECLVRAIPLIVKACDDVKFFFKGTGPLEGFLKKLTKKLGVWEYVRFAGLVPHQELPRFLSAADIYVSTCFIDSTSVSLLEAMACKLAPVVTDIPGNREWIENGSNGFLYPPKNDVELANKIIRLVEDCELRRNFSERCVDIIRRRAMWDDCVSRMQAIYETFMKR